MMFKNVGYRAIEPLRSWGEVKKLILMRRKRRTHEEALYSE